MKKFSIKNLQEMCSENLAEIMRDEIEEDGGDEADQEVEVELLPKGRVEIQTSEQRFLITIEEV